MDEKGSENIWIAVMGPDTLANGERQNVAPVTKSQIAATVAAFLGKDFPQDVPAAAAPLPDVRWIPARNRRAGIDECHIPMTH